VSKSNSSDGHVTGGSVISGTVNKHRFHKIVSESGVTLSENTAVINNPSFHFRRLVKHALNIQSSDVCYILGVFIGLHIRVNKRLRSTECTSVSRILHTYESVRALLRTRPASVSIRRSRIVLIERLNASS